MGLRPYVVWKYCLSLKQCLYTICRKVWPTGKTPILLESSCDRAISKIWKTSDPTNFQPTAVLNCDGILFFSLWSKSFISYIICNEYFDKQTQEVFSKHLRLCRACLHFTRSSSRCPAASPLDLFRSGRPSKCFQECSPHKHVQHHQCLHRYHFLSDVCKLIVNYYEWRRILAKVSINGGMTPTFAMGVFQGCVLIPAIFNICFPLGLKSGARLPSSSKYPNYR